MRDSGNGNVEDADGPANVDLKEFVASTRSQPAPENSNRSGNRLRPYLGSESSAVDGQMNGHEESDWTRKKKPTVGFQPI